MASLDVLRAFFAKKIQTRWIDYTLEPVLLKFIKCIDYNCLHVAKLNEKSEIKIRLGLLLFVLMHINHESDHLYIQCASFLKIKSYSEVTKKNQKDLLFKLRDFIDNTMSQLIDISPEEVFGFRGELVECLSKIEGIHDKSYYDTESFIDPRDNFASFGEFAYQSMQVVTSLAGNLSSFFSLQNEPGTLFGNTKLRGLKYSNKDAPEFFKRWLDALLRLPDNALSEQNKRVIRKIMRVEPEEKLEDDFVEVDPEQIPPSLRLGQA